MVLHFIERIIGTYGDPKRSIRSNTVEEHLIENGFDEEEARNLRWFNNKQYLGKFFGLLGGMWVAYVYSPQLKLLSQSSPRLRYQQWWNPLIKVSIVATGYLLGDYIATSRLRRGADDGWSTLYNTNDFLKTREFFIRNFEPLNRKFTEEEINQFQLQEHQRLGIERKWNYNPYVHGDEASYFKTVNNAQSCKPAYLEPEVRAKINQQNKDKIDAGEKIVEKPFKLVDIIDQRGEKQGIVKLPWTSGWHVLH